MLYGLDLTQVVGITT